MKHAPGEDHSYAKIIFVIVCLKGGVGKSTLSSSIAYYLANTLHKNVGLWDMDITSPSVAKVLNLQGRELTFTRNGKLAPIQQSEHLQVMSVDFLLPSADQPIVFNEKKKKTHMVQFLKAVEFGKCDYFVFDTPPTTSPELMTILKLFSSKKMRIILVTQPGDASENSVKKSIQHLKSTGIPITGIICNMDGFTCPNCGHYDPVFPNPVSIEDLAKQYKIPYLGGVQLGTVKKANGGAMVFQGKHFENIARKILKTKPVKFKPMKNKLSMFKKAMMVHKMDSNLDKLIK